MAKKLICGVTLATIFMSCLSGCGNGIGKEGISLEEYMEIERGSYLEDVEEIVGGKGDVIESYVDEENTWFRIYEFRGEKNGKAWITVVGDVGLVRKKEEFDLK